MKKKKAKHLHNQNRREPKVYWAKVYVRRVVRGKVRLYLRDASERRVGYVDTNAKAADLLVTGVLYPWAAGVVVHTWKSNRPAQQVIRDVKNK